MKQEVLPTQEDLERHAKKIPEIDPSAVIAMLEIMRVSERIQHSVFDVLETEHQLSEGKLCVMIILYQRYGKPIVLSELARLADVTKATISVMLRRMQRDGLVKITVNSTDARSREVVLSQKGLDFLSDILPGHYLRISRLMGHLSVEERQELIRLTAKLADS